jgi:hypothetical protein
MIVINVFSTQRNSHRLLTSASQEQKLTVEDEIDQFSVKDHILNIVVFVVRLTPLEALTSVLILLQTAGKQMGITVLQLKRFSFFLQNRERRVNFQYHIIIIISSSV